MFDGVNFLGFFFGGEDVVMFVIIVVYFNKVDDEIVCDWVIVMIKV